MFITLMTTFCYVISRESGRGLLNADMVPIIGIRSRRAVVLESFKKMNF